MKVASPCIALLLYIVVSGFTPKYVGDALSWMSCHRGSQEGAAISLAITSIVLLIVLVGFTSVHEMAIKQRIVGETAIIKKVLKGILWAIFAFPVSIVIAQAVHALVDFFGPFAHGEQLPIALLKSIREHTFLFWFFVLLIVTVIPALEELLFRGYFQNFFGDWLGAQGALFLTSALFALFHYSGSQQASNIELMAGLFVASYLLGLCYFREKSLVASIAMHASFNAFSVLFLILGIQ